MEPLDGLIPTLDDGRPATFVAVTTDYAAVEVDTASGDMLRSIAQVATGADVENAECAACVNYVEKILRLADGSAYLISECCEPAAGVMFWMEPGDQVTPENHDHREPMWGWYVSPAPLIKARAVSGYGFGVASPESGRSWDWQISVVDPLYAATPPSWSRDLKSLHLIDDQNGLWTADLVSGNHSTGELSWLADDQFAWGLATQESGRLVTFGVDGGPEENPFDNPTRGIVFEPTGALYAEFDVEAGSRMGTYDPSGRFLIYVDGQGTVRWQGLGQSGVLGEGFFFASW
jgi:hypothetical protein